MPAKNPPMLMQGPLSGAVYIVTSYKVIDAERGIFEARTKYDVTAQFEAIAAARAAVSAAEEAT
jgi:hypothetical protein